MLTNLTMLGNRKKKDNGKSSQITQQKIAIWLMNVKDITITLIKVQML